MSARRISLRLSLIRSLVSVLALMGVAGTVGAYLLGERYAGLAYDRALFDDVNTLGGEVSLSNDQLQVNLPPSAQRWLLNDEGEQVIYRVVDMGTGRVLFKNGDLGPLPEEVSHPGQANFRDALIAGASFRIAYAKYLINGTAPVLVEIGETTSKRQLIGRQVLLGASLFVALMITTAAALVWRGIGSALLPLALLEGEVMRRSVADLAPLELGSVPEEVRRMVASVNDLMTRLAQSIDSQKRFVANAAHQMRTPVAGLHLRAQQLAQQQVSPEIRQTIGEIEQEALRVAHLMDQLLILSKLHSPEQDAHSVAIDLVKVVAQVIERCLPRAIASGIDLGYEGPAGQLMVLGNEILFSEMVANLVDNSLRYGGSGGVVTVAAGQSAGLVFLEVADRGPGFPEALMRQLFQRFVRSDSSPSGGAGLGLAIVKEIAERYGARVSVDSKVGDCRVRIEILTARGESAIVNKA